MSKLSKILKIVKGSTVPEPGHVFLVVVQVAALRPHVLHRLEIRKRWLIETEIAMV